ncbi:kelch-like protein diablo [Bactrocera tryoni]|uniref:kelch-like protein diablo n=1 Tax=Bactrocera tryoni TaxID=59916 RepID=UPI001A99E589|nr:kelch-like protein diablo [Bactrocera tryoni]
MADKNTEASLMANAPSSSNLEYKFSDRVLAKIRECRSNNQYIDVVFTVGERQKRIPAHRLVLAASSSYFQELFTTEEDTSEISLKHIDANSFETLINYCYTGCLTLDERAARKLVIAAKILQFKEVARYCNRFIVNKLSYANLLDIISFADDHGCKDLRAKAFGFAVEHFKELLTNGELLRFSPALMEELVESDELNVYNEADVFDAIMRWHKYDEENRRPYLINLLSLLRITQLEPAFVFKHIKPIPGSDRLILDALDWFHVPETRWQTKLKYTKPRNSRNCLMAVEVNIMDESKRFLRYDPIADTWARCGQVLGEKTDYGTIFVKNSLVFIGNKYLVRFDLEKQQWETPQPVRKRRELICVAVLQDNIYLIGGYCKTTKNTVEMFDMRTGDWLRVAPMLEGRYCAKAVVFDERIYVMGGSENECALNSVECYDPMLDTWEARACMIEARASPGAAVAHGYIYVLGGYNDSPLDTVERFNPVKNEWTKVCSLTTARSRISAIVFNYQLLALGGTKNGEGVNCVEEYNVDTDKWVLKAPMPTGAAYSSFVVPTHLADNLQTVLADGSRPVH